MQSGSHVPSYCTHRTSAHPLHTKENIVNDISLFQFWVINLESMVNKSSLICMRKFTLPERKTWICRRKADPTRANLKWLWEEISNILIDNKMGTRGFSAICCCCCGGWLLLEMERPRVETRLLYLFCRRRWRWRCLVVGNKMNEKWMPESGGKTGWTW